MTPGADTFSRFLWFATLLSTLFGGLFLSAAFFSDSAPQQAAAAALGLGCAALPYVLARSWDELMRDPVAPRVVATAASVATAGAELVETTPRRPRPAWERHALLILLGVVLLALAVAFGADWWKHPEAYPFGR